MEQARDAELRFGADTRRESEGGEKPRPTELTDVIMPRMAGPQLADNFRREHPETHVLLMSGFAAPILNAQGQIHQDFELLDKPFSAPTLLAKVAQALAQ